MIVVDIDNFSDYIQKHSNEKHIASLKRRLFELVSNVSADSRKSIVISQSDSVVVIVEAITLSAETRCKSAEKLAELLKTRIDETLQDMTVSLGIGSATKCISDFRKSYDEAKMVLNVLKLFGRKNSIMSFDHIGIYSLLFHIKSKEKMLEFCQNILGQLIDYDEKNSANLIPTLLMFMRNNCNLKKTSKAAFLHINTLNYRLRRIYEIGNIDLDDSEQRLNLQVALKIWELTQLDYK